MRADVTKMLLVKESPKKFSLCTIVSDEEEYNKMYQSFLEKGFDNDCEYLIADNTVSNEFDAYTAIKRFLLDAKGEFLIIVHQDVRCIDDKDKLLNILNALEQLDKNWAVCGNAGGDGYRKLYFNLDNNGIVLQSKDLPMRVYTLDENLLILKSSAGLAISGDIGHFHLYGTDLCLVADYLGYSCYVVDFMVKHLSLGNLKDLHNQTPVFISKYSRKLRNRFIQTTCTKFYLSNSITKNHLYNKKIIFFWMKAWRRLKNNFFL